MSSSLVLQYIEIDLNNVLLNNDERMKVYHLARSARNQKIVQATVETLQFCFSNNFIDENLHQTYNVSWVYVSSNELLHFMVAFLKRKELPLANIKTIHTKNGFISALWSWSLISSFVRVWFPVEAIISSSFFLKSIIIMKHFQVPDIGTIIESGA